MPPAETMPSTVSEYSSQSGERLRDAAARVGAHERGARARHPGVAPEPPRRVRRKPHEEGQVAAHAVERPDRRVGVGHPHVHVQRALRGAPDQAAHRLADAPVALLVDEPGVAVLGVGVDADAHQRRTRRARGEACAVECRDRLVHARGDRRARLDLGGIRLVGELRTRVVGVREHALRHRGERERGAIHQQQLLLDAEREGAAEGVLHQRSSSADSAAIRPSTSAAASPLE